MILLYRNYARYFTIAFTIANATSRDVKHKAQYYTIDVDVDVDNPGIDVAVIHSGFDVYCVAFIRALIDALTDDNCDYATTRGKSRFPFDAACEFSFKCQNYFSFTSVTFVSIFFIDD